MSGIVETTRNAAGNLVIRSREFIDGAFPPEQRRTFISKVQAFTSANPKLSTFIFANLLLSGLPLVTFITFSISAFLFCLISTLVLSILITVFLTIWAVGFALLFFLPVIFLTTLGATFLWVWGTGAYLIFQYFNQDDALVSKNNAVGKKLKQLTGGRVDVTANTERGSHNKTNGIKPEPIRQTTCETTEGIAEKAVLTPKERISSPPNRGLDLDPNSTVPDLPKPIEA